MKSHKVNSIVTTCLVTFEMLQAWNSSSSSHCALPELIQTQYKFPDSVRPRRIEREDLVYTHIIASAPKYLNQDFGLSRFLRRSNSYVMSLLLD